MRIEFTNNALLIFVPNHYTPRSGCLNNSWVKPNTVRLFFVFFFLFFWWRVVYFFVLSFLDFFNISIFLLIYSSLCRYLHFFMLLLCLSCFFFSFLDNFKKLKSFLILQNPFSDRPKFLLKSDHPLSFPFQKRSAIRASFDKFFKSNKSRKRLGIWWGGSNIRLPSKLFMCLTNKLEP